VEHVETRRVLLDVHVTDRKHRPVPGLRAEDFEVFVGRTEWPVRGVDDYCRCRAWDVDESDTPPSRGEPAEAGSDRAREQAPSEPGEVSGQARFVLYLDFSQLSSLARERAFREARRWIRETRRPGDRSMIVAHASGTGLDIVQPFTTDGEELLTALDAVEADSRWIDDAALMRSMHRDLCLSCMARRCRNAAGPTAFAGMTIPLCKGTSCARDCCGSECYDRAREEVRNGERAMSALRLLMSKLERTPGRKELLYFQHTGAMFPGRLYGVSDFDAGDLVSEVDRVGAEATLARTRIHAVTLRRGDSGVNFGANLADVAGGGTYTRGSGALPELLDAAGRECCWYTLALEPPEDAPRWPRRVRVRVRLPGETWELPLRANLIVLDDRDRWHRRAQGLLLGDARRSGQVDVLAGLTPLTLEDGRWRVRVEVVVDTSSLEGLPGARGVRLDWGVGAVIAADAGRDVRSFERFSAAELIDGGAQEELVVAHRREILLEPGPVELSAYAGDVQAWRFGGSWCGLELPDPDSSSGIAGPVLRVERAGRALGLRSRGEDLGRPGDGDSRSEGPLLVPAPSELGEGDVVVATTWLCHEGQPPDPDRLLTSLADGTGVHYRFSAEDTAIVGDCLRLTDRFAVLEGVLPPGRYAYVVREASAPEGAEPVGRASFHVGSGDAAIDPAP
jgi:VWFA-related protein